MYKVWQGEEWEMGGDSADRAVGPSAKPKYFRYSASVGMCGDGGGKFERLFLW